MKILNWVKHTKLYLSYKDIYNYIQFRKIIKAEEKNPQSKYHKLNINRNFLYTLNFIITLPEETANLTADQRRVYLTEYIKPYVEYVGNDLKFGEYLVADIKQFFDEDGPTLSYGVMFSFVFIYLTFKQILKWLVYICIITGLIYAWPFIIEFVKKMF